MKGVAVSWLHGLQRARLWGAPAVAWNLPVDLRGLGSYRNARFGTVAPACATSNEILLPCGAVITAPNLETTMN